MKTFWDERYEAEGEIWGNLPSKTVVRADAFFHEHQCRKVLVPGCGYGRNANYFQKKGYDVTGVDFSEKAVFMARKFNPKIDYITESVFDVDFPFGSFEAVYAFNILHFFLEAERKCFIRQYCDYIRPGGIAYFTVFSEEEKDFGKGSEVEPNTFEAKLGRPAHYFTREDLLNHFTLYTVLEDGLVEESENHPPDGRHLHYLRYIIVKI